ncbi:hypothetical protein SDC9_07944 [bioreactor metagenome]|uniref:Uncharacterized protein n=1 Tax=bioreactor metagenome TaxID=1076179 RepID=A0A644T648_9ZZZZ
MVFILNIQNLTQSLKICYHKNTLLKACSFEYSPKNTYIMTVIEVQATILVPFDQKEMDRNPRVKKLFLAHGEETFIHEVLEKYFSDSEIGKIFAGGLRGWQLRLEKLLEEAAQEAGKVE